MEFLGTWLATAVACAAAIAFVPGIDAVGDSYIGPIMCALALSLINATIKPVAQFLSLPITVLTLGIFYVVVNALLLELASSISVALFGMGIQVQSFGAAFLGSIVISLVSAIVGSIVMD